MFHVEKYQGNKAEQSVLVIKQLRALVEGEEDIIANLSNASALLNQFLEDINWVGFYLLKEDQLVLGPFQGLPACVRIPLGRGVCGTAADKKETLRIADVHQFPGHIACDAASNSEIVVPLVSDGKVIGVLDIDSPSKNRFNEQDQTFLEEFVNVLMEHV
ncbi:GAF domain-containing protein [Metabacillus halosaccharovorans]|uniref:GAF domain-containing protein n=1 Tax=Metabacillus halosaccharovorans TaxID=930124 RepID=A0ABT3DP74_9BACI|nr:GAF domain-containing protein [Metabacillus halosaccharovorans]MCV9888870.1 GAF domain-containing protein [Metabacillus halosaccharovorans]